MEEREDADKAAAVQEEPKAFTWQHARMLAVIVRDALLMIVKGFERVFDLGKK